MVKGKPWSHTEVKQLQELRHDGKTVKEIATLMGKSPDSVKQKLRRIGLKVVTLQNSEGSTTSIEKELILPDDLPSIEMALLKIAAAMTALENPNLTKTDIMRLRTLIQTSTIYQKRFAEYVGYRQIERKVNQAIEWLTEHQEAREKNKTNH